MLFLVNSLLLGFALAMDAFSVSVADGLTLKDTKRSRKILIAFSYGLFQALMPMLGWVIVISSKTLFSKISRFIPWAALIILAFLGIKMIVEGFKKEKGEEEETSKFKDNFSMSVLLLQSVATSIDALSVGLANADLDLIHSIVSSAIIGIVTFILCVTGVEAGRKIGSKVSGISTVVGGVILVAIGVKIFLSSAV